MRGGDVVVIVGGGGQWGGRGHHCGSCLEKRLVHCTCRSVIKDDKWKTDLWSAPCCVGVRVGGLARQGKACSRMPLPFDDRNCRHCPAHVSQT
jgi:hypothetical protein